MVSLAAKAWGVTVKDIEKADPIVPLLIDACASEINRIYSAMSNNSEKMIDKIMELLTPIELTSPFPARAILRAVPMDTKAEIDENNHFYSNKKIYVEDSVKDIDVSFTPTRKFFIFKGQVKYFASGDRIVLKTGAFEGEAICKAKSAKEIAPNTFWIGLQLAKPLESMAGLSFYFNFDEETATPVQQEIFYNAMQHASWQLENQPMNVVNGFANDPGEKAYSLNFESSREFSKSVSICNHINIFYKKQFYTVQFDDRQTLNLQEMKKKFPDAFSDVFDAEDLNEIDGNFLWLKVSFTQFISADIINKMNCSINCFPVVNRRAEKVFITGKEKIKGLESENYETYFDLKQFSTNSDLNIIFDDVKKEPDEGNAFLSLRQDNIGRYSSRNALELIQQLINTYREEFPAFTKFKNVDQDSIDNLNIAVRPFEYILDDLNAISFDAMPYIMFKTNQENEDKQVQVNYWLTNGSIANGIRKEEHLLYDSADLMRDNIFLMTTTMGGIDRKQNDELVHDFRYALISRDRIVTKMDIKALCYKVFNGAIDSLEVKEGVTSSTLPSAGIRRCMNVMIRLSRSNDMDQETIDFLKEDLITQLVDKSSSQIPVKVFID